MNPFTATNGIQAAPAETVETEDERTRRLREEAAARQWREDDRFAAGA